MKYGVGVLASGRGTAALLLALGAIGCSGETGPAGEPGPAGPAGAQGEMGTPGTMGAPGAGHSALVSTTTEPPGSNCTTGGVKLEVGLDADDDGVLSASEIDAAKTQYICNGSQGPMGATGATGAPGTSGTSVAQIAPRTGAQVTITTAFPTYTQVAAMTLPAGKWLVHGRFNIYQNAVVISNVVQNPGAYCQLKAAGATDFADITPAQPSGTFGYPTGSRMAVQLQIGATVASTSSAIIECTKVDIDAEVTASNASFTAVKVDTLDVVTLQ